MNWKFKRHFIQLLLSGFSDVKSERKYQNHLFETHQKFLKLAVIVGSVLLMSFSSIDILAGEYGAEATKIRALLYFPIFILFSLVFILRSSPGNWQIMITAFGLLAHIQSMHVVVVLDPAGNFGISTGTGALNTAAVMLFVLALFPISTRYASVWALTVLLIYLFTYYLFSSFDVRDLIAYGSNLLAITFTAIIFSAWREWIMRTDFEKQLLLSEEKKRSEMILYHHVPERVLQRMRNGEAPISEAHLESYILFADVVNFSKLTNDISPRMLVEVLNDLFRRMSKVAQQQGIEHFRSSGDSFMIAQLGDQSSTLENERILDLALATDGISKQVSKKYQIDLQLRVGLHVGFAVGGVLEATSPFYDFWGSNVNFTRRLEETGEQGRVHVSEAIRARFAGKFLFVKRENVELKGFGHMSTFWLNGRAVSND